MTDLQSTKHTYTIGNQLRIGISEATNEAGETVIVKTSRDPKLTYEMMMLATLHDEANEKFGDRFDPFFPTVVEHFRHGLDIYTVFAYEDGFLDLQRVLGEYPKGLDGRDMAWIFRRVLAALGAAHQVGLTHGQLNEPQHVLVHPTKHGVIILDWTLAESLADTVTPVPGGTFSCDIADAARLMIRLVGGDPDTKAMPDTVPVQLRTFLRTKATPVETDAWVVLEKFDTLLERLWGPRKYRPLDIPNPNP